MVLSNTAVLNLPPILIAEPLSPTAPYQLAWLTVIVYMETPVSDVLDTPASVLSTVAQLCAENVDLQSKLRLLECELNTERDILKRMMNIDPSLPISLLVSLLSIAYRKREDNASLISSQRLHEGALERLECIRDREDWLMAAASASGGPTFFGHSRRWQSLRNERTEAEAELKIRVQQVTLMRERLAKLEVLEKQSWGALSSNANRPRSGRSNRPISRKSDSALTNTSRTLTPLVITRDMSPALRPGSGMKTENGNSPSMDSTNLPEIPDSPTLANYSASETRHSVSVVHPAVTPSPRTLPVIFDPPPSTMSHTPRPPTLAPFSAMVAQSRNSATSSMLTSSYSRSSAAETTLGPLTPFTSYSDLPSTQNHNESSPGRTNVRGSRKHLHRVSTPQPPPEPSKRSEASQAPKAGRTVDSARTPVENQAPTAFEFPPFSMAPLGIKPFPGLNDVPFPSASATAPSNDSRTASGTKNHGRYGVDARDNGSQGTLKKLVPRGIFRGSASGVRNTHVTSKRTPNAPTIDTGNHAAANSARPKSRLEPLVESWVLEQLQAPPPSPSAREVTAYYSENDALDSRKLRGPFAGRLKPTVGGWLGGGSR